MGRYWGHGGVVSCLTGLILLLGAGGLLCNGCSLNPQPSPPVRDGSAEPTTGSASSGGSGMPITPPVESTDGSHVGGGDVGGGDVGVDVDGDGIIDGIDSDGDGIIDSDVEDESNDTPALTTGGSGGPTPTPSDGGAAGAAGARATNEPESIP